MGIESMKEVDLDISYKIKVIVDGDDYKSEEDLAYLEGKVDEFIKDAILKQKKNIFKDKESDSLGYNAWIYSVAS